MIEEEKLDAVMVETTTHARAWIAIQAMQAGLDTYIEKPMALTISEGRTMVCGGAKYSRVTQVGIQQRPCRSTTGQATWCERGVGQDAYRGGPEFRRSRSMDQDFNEGCQGTGGALVGHVDQPGQVAAL